MKEGILWRVLSGDSTIVVSLNCHPGCHEFCVLSEVEMQRHSKCLDIVEPRTRLFCVPFLPPMFVKNVREKSAILLSLYGRCHIIFWNCKNKLMLHYHGKLSQ